MIFTYSNRRLHFGAGGGFDLLIYFTSLFIDIPLTVDCTLEGGKVALGFGEVDNDENHCDGIEKCAENDHTDRGATLNDRCGIVVQHIHILLNLTDHFEADDADRNIKDAHKEIGQTHRKVKIFSISVRVGRNDEENET